MNLYPRDTLLLPVHDDEKKRNNGNNKVSIRDPLAFPLKPHFHLIETGLRGANLTGGTGGTYYFRLVDSGRHSISTCSQVVINRENVSKGGKHLGSASNTYMRASRAFQATFLRITDGEKEGKEG